jgi:amino acid adenylation domain-containing protein
MNYLSKTIESRGWQRGIKPDYNSVSGSFIEFKKEELHQSIPDRFEKLVRECPNRVAIKMGKDVITYSQLNADANRLARAIIGQRGDHPEPIGLLFEKGAPLVAAMLAVLKTGKFFVPLDTSFPKARIADTIQDSQLALIIADGQNIPLSQELASNTYQVVAFDDFTNKFSPDDLRLSISPEALAFIVYTSGSTGRPKGVMWDHRNLLHYAMLQSNASCAGENDRVSLLTSGTGNAVNNTFFTLLSRAALYPFDVAKEGVSRLANWLLEEKISICLIASPLFRCMCEHLTQKARFPHIRFLRLTSEKVCKVDVDFFKRHFSSNCTLVNGLTSTEAGSLTMYRVGRHSEISEAEVPVGYSLQDKEILLLNDQGQNVGFNEIGEIVVRSQYLSRGYWRRPDLTETKFKRDPDNSGRSLYWTGDLGLMRPDGCLIHKGRKDCRVKIRGYGVDIAEVENSLLRHTGVREAILLARQNDLGESHLVAYFTSNLKSGPSVSVLRNFLRDKLPDYMVPSVFVRLNEIPLTPNGKIDRNALPNPDNRRPDINAPFAPPRTSTEAKLAEILTELLGVNQIGVHDDFFDLGGHSLLAARLFVQINKAFGTELPITTLYWARTVERLANIVQRDRWSAPWSLLCPIQSSGSKPPFFWVYGDTSDVFLPVHLGPDQPLYGLMHEGRTGKRVIYKRLEDIAAHHLKEIYAVQPRGPYYLGGYCFGGMVAFEMARQLKKQGQKIGLLFLLDLATIKNCKFLLNQYRPLAEPSEKIESFRAKAYRHFRKLTTLETREQLKYVMVRVRDGIVKSLIPRGNHIAKKVTRNAEKVIRKLYFMTGSPLPISFRVHYVSEVDRWAMENYQPQAYSGNFVHVKARGRDADHRLVEKLIAGGLEAYEIPCRHVDLLKEQYIHLWADKLQCLLSNVQANMRSKIDDCYLSKSQATDDQNQNCTDLSVLNR